MNASYAERVMICYQLGVSVKDIAKLGEFGLNRAGELKKQIVQKYKLYEHEIFDSKRAKIPTQLVLDELNINVKALEKAALTEAKLKGLPTTNVKQPTK